MCRLYGCRPSELEFEDAATVRAHLALYNAEERVKAQRQRDAQSKGRGTA